MRLHRTSQRARDKKWWLKSREVAAPSARTLKRDVRRLQPLDKVKNVSGEKGR